MLVLNVIMILRKVTEKRIVYILAGTLILLLIVLISLINKKRVLDQQIMTQQGSELSQDQGVPPVASSLPRTAFADYTLNTDLPTLPTSVKLADLKTSHTTGEALDLATRIGFNNPVVDEGAGMVLVSDQDGEGNQVGLLQISKKSGDFLIVSETGYPTEGTDPVSAAQSFLSKMGIWDDTLVPTATFKRESSPGVVFVEIHRSWEMLGLPILNPIGTLNLSETERVADVRLGYIENSAPDDTDVIESSDDLPGKTRPNQFNTVTVGVVEDNLNVMNVTSNLKLFANTQEKESDQALKTPEEALEDLKSGRTSFSLVKPLGAGVYDVQNVFPDSQAVSDTAVINEVVLTYLDEVGQTTQSTLYPHYLFRGTATLASGYQVQFVETVSAVKQINALGVFAAQNTLPTVFPGQGSTLQYGTFNWLSPAPNRNAGLACAGLTQLFQLPNGGYIGWYPNTEPRNWFYVPPPGEIVDAARLKEVKKILRWEAAKACQASKIDPTVCAYADGNVDLQAACYYLGSGSPYVYVYTKTAQKMQINLPKSVTYTNPSLSENSWIFTSYPEQTLTFADGITKSKLYYEYDKKVFNSTLPTFKKSQKGFLVDKDELAGFVSALAKQTGLNATEETDLLVEMTREARKVSTDTLKVGLIDRQTVDKILPVSINPQPQSFTRVFFYLTSATGQEKLTAPLIQKVTRDGDTVVEVGVLGY